MSEGMQFTIQECTDLTTALTEAQDELCVDLDGNQFPESTAYYHRLEALKARIGEYYSEAIA